MWWWWWWWTGINISVSHTPAPHQTAEVLIELVEGGVVLRQTVVESGEDSTASVLRWKPAHYCTAAQTPRTIQSYVKTLDGRTITLTVTPEDSVSRIRGMIHDRVGVPPDQQRLLHMGKTLEDGWSLADYNVENESTIHLALCLRGGKPITVFVRAPVLGLSEPNTVIEVDGSHSITTLKAMVGDTPMGKLLQPRFGRDLGLLQVYHKSKRLRNEEGGLRELGVGDQEALFLLPRSAEAIFSMPSSGDAVVSFTIAAGSATPAVGGRAFAETIARKLLAARGVKLSAVAEDINEGTEELARFWSFSCAWADLEKIGGTDIAINARVSITPFAPTPLEEERVFIGFTGPDGSVPLNLDPHVLKDEVQDFFEIAGVLQLVECSPTMVVFSCLRSTALCILVGSQIEVDCTMYYRIEVGVAVPPMACPASKAEAKQEKRPPPLPTTRDPPPPPSCTDSELTRISRESQGRDTSQHRGGGGGGGVRGGGRRVRLPTHACCPAVPANASFSS